MVDLISDHSTDAISTALDRRNESSIASDADEVNEDRRQEG
jgi:hypothetical protein